MGNKILNWFHVLIFIYTIFIFTCNCKKENKEKIPETSWQKSLGGSVKDIARSVQQTTDGRYIVAGSSKSDDGDIIENHGDYDYWIAKLTSTGKLDWQKSLGGSMSDVALCIQQTTDGEYIMAGISLSTDGDVTGNHGDYDYWIVKLTSTGELD